MTDEIEEVKDAVAKHEEDLSKQEEAVSKLIEDNKDKKGTDNDSNTGSNT